MDGNQPIKTEELSLIEAVVRQENGTWDRFVRRYSDLIYSTCSSIFAEDDIEKEYLLVFRALQANNFAALRVFNGQAPFTTFLSFKLRGILAHRILELFKENSDRAWSAFQRYFHKVLDPIKRRDEDLYQEICLQLIENHYRRIVGFDGRGNFAGYIRRVIDNLCLDLCRHAEGRRRLPEAVQRLPELEQEIYRQIQWKGCKEKDLLEVLRDEAGKPYPVERIKRALAQLGDLAVSQVTARIRETSLVMTDSDGEEKELEIPDVTHAPESRLLSAESERVTGHYLAALRESFASLPPDLGLYIRLRFYSNPPKPPREIARLMGRTEREVYRIRQEAMTTLKLALKNQGVEKNPDLSV